MGSRSRRTDAPEDFNIWQAYTDLMSNAFMIISLFLLFALIQSNVLKAKSELGEETLVEANEKIWQLQSQLNTLQTQLTEKNQEIARIEAERKQLASAPPVLIIQNSGEYSFSSGQATLPDALRTYIWNDLVNQIEQITQERDIYVVEIIGHTDGQATGSQYSNLDQILENVASGNQGVTSLSAGSNADLGLMRALEVVKQLQYIQQQGRLQGLQFRAYSAAQLLLPSGEFAPVNRTSDATRRRIEIRFSPLGDARTIN